MSSQGDKEMTTFYIVRHGQTENNLHGRLSGWLDTPLTNEGRLNARTAARKLQGVHIDFIVASDLGRAMGTAEIIARELGLDPEVIKPYEALREVNYGMYGNAPIVDYPRLHPEENAGFTPPGGESLIHMQTRVLHCIEKLAAEHPGKTILMAAHDGTINAIRAAHTKENIGVVDAVGANPHDIVARFTCSGGKITTFEEKR
jgi:broad specificity phosphatase PhoE